MSKVFQSVVGGWRSLKEQFPRVNHSWLATRFRVVDGVDFFNYQRVLHEVQNLTTWPIIKDKDTQHIVDTFAECKRLLLETGKRTNEKLFPVTAESRTGRPAMKFSLEDAADEAHMLLAFKYAHSMQYDRVENPAETEAFKDKAAEQLTLAGADPEADAPWKKIGVEHGVAGTCHAFIHTIKAVRVPNFMMAIAEFVRQPDKYAEMYEFYGSVLIDALGAVQHAGYKSPDDVLKPLGFPVTVAELERKVKGYRALMYGDGIISRLLSAVRDGVDQAPVQELHEISMRLMDAGWSLADAELWSIFRAHVPQLDIYGDNWADFIRQHSHSAVPDGGVVKREFVM